MLTEKTAVSPFATLAKKPSIKMKRASKLTCLSLFARKARVLAVLRKRSQKHCRDRFFEPSSLLRTEMLQTRGRNAAEPGSLLRTEMLLTRDRKTAEPSRLFRNEVI